MVILSADIWSMLVLLQFHASFSAESLRCLYVNLWLASATTPHHLCRTHLLWELLFILHFFKLSWPCRCLCWDHASSLECENIMLSWWPSPMPKLTWGQLRSRSACTFQLAVVCSAGYALSDYTTRSSNFVCTVFIYLFGIPKYVVLKDNRSGKPMLVRAEIVRHISQLTKSFGVWHFMVDPYCLQAGLLRSEIWARWWIQLSSSIPENPLLLQEFVDTTLCVIVRKSEILVQT